MPLKCGSEFLQAPDDIHGTVIRTVRSGSPAEDAGLSPGDVILSVNRNPVRSPDDVLRELVVIPKGQDALVLVWASGGKAFRVLHSWEE